MKYLNFLGFIYSSFYQSTSQFKSDYLSASELSDNKGSIKLCRDVL